MPVESAAVLQLSGITKAYGPTRALGGLSFRAATDEVIGLIGANGAGKSTLMRILAGVTMPDTGMLEIAGNKIDPGDFSPARARALGIRIVHQELSLCDSLSVAENFYVEQPGRADLDPRWLRRYARMARDSIDSIFPDNGIDVRRPVSELSLPQRQMVEIARAACDSNLRVLILDEPTSSLNSSRSEQLARFIQTRAAAGALVIFISHKLQEVAAISTRILVLRNGVLTSDTRAGAITVPQMVAAMAGEAAQELEQLHHVAARSDGETLVAIGAPWSAEPVQLRTGQIVGLAGLEGNGQRGFLRALYETARGGLSPGLACTATASYVSGDRGAEGIFPLWSVLKNATIGITTAKSGIIREHAERRTA